MSYHVQHNEILRGDDRPLLYSASSPYPSAKITICRLLAVAEASLSVGILVAGIFNLRTDDWNDNSLTGCIGLMVCTILGGICAVTSVIKLTSLSVKILIGIHAGFALLDLILIALLGVGGHGHEFLATLILSIIAFIIHLVFTSIFGTLTSLKNLESPPIVCC